jgi:hypothetical protein
VHLPVLVDGDDPHDRLGLVIPGQRFATILLSPISARIGRGQGPACRPLAVAPRPAKLPEKVVAVAIPSQLHPFHRVLEVT